MPIGLFINCISSFLGSVTGGWAGSRLSPSFKTSLYDTMGLCALGIGIINIVKASQIPPVILAIVLGTALGSLFHVEEHLTHGIQKILKKTGSCSLISDIETYSTAIILFCFSGFGIFGVLTEAISGNPEILLAKSVLDFSMALCFGAKEGSLLCLVSIPQILFLSLLFCTARYFGSALPSEVMNNFIACGGLLTLAAGMKISSIKPIPLANMLPSLALVILFSYLPFF